MELLFLGSGNADAQLERGQSGTLVSAGETRVLLDCGSGTLHRLLRAGHHPQDLDAIVLTHAHPDHVVDLVAILFELKQSRPDRTGALPILGPPAAEKVYDGLMDLFGQWCVGETYDVAYRAVEEDETAIGDLSLRFAPMRHALPAVGVRFTGPGGAAVTHTGDTGPHPGIAELARGSRVLVCDCTLPDGAEFSGHMDARDAGRAASAAGVERLVLTHLSAEAGGEDLVALAGQTFPGEVIVARDLLRVEV